MLFYIQAVGDGYSGRTGEKVLVGFCAWPVGPQMWNLPLDYLWAMLF